MMKFAWLLTLISCVGCNNQSSKDVITQKVNKVDSLKSTLQGNWGGLGEDFPVWQIKNDSIYFYQEDKTYAYQILDKNMVIERNDSEEILRNISVYGDTMRFYYEHGMPINAYRFDAKIQIIK